MQIANRDAVITEQYETIEAMEKELKEYRDKEVEEMEKAADADKEKEKSNAKK